MNKLKVFRERSDLTQSELAERSGVDQGTISRLERGIGDVSGKKWKALAGVLGCSVSELMEG